MLTVSKTSTTSIKEAEPMDKRLTRWTAAALLLGSLTFLGGCSPQNTTVNPDTKKEYAAADQAEHRDPVHGVEGGLKDKEKEQEGKSQNQHRASPGRIQGMLQGKAGTKRVQKKDLH